MRHGNVLLMYQSIPTGYIPTPGNPRENLFKRANPGHLGKLFCLIPCPGLKNDGQIPGGGAKVSQTQRNFPLSLQKNPQEIQKTTNFLFGELNKTFKF